MESITNLINDYQVQKKNFRKIKALNALCKKTFNMLSILLPFIAALSTAAPTKECSDVCTIGFSKQGAQLESPFCGPAQGKTISSSESLELQQFYVAAENENAGVMFSFNANMRSDIGRFVTFDMMHYDGESNVGIHGEFNGTHGLQAFYFPRSLEYIHIPHIAVSTTNCGSDSFCGQTPLELAGGDVKFVHLVNNVTNDDLLVFQTRNVSFTVSSEANSDDMIYFKASLINGPPKTFVKHGLCFQ